MKHYLSATIASTGVSILFKAIAGIILKDLRINVNSESLLFKPGVPVKVGRSVEADVRVDVPEVSRIHGIFNFDVAQNNWIYADNNSANGSYVDGKKITQFMVVKPKSLFIGDLEKLVELQLSIEEEVLPEPIAEPVEEVTQERVPVQLPPGTYTCGYCTGPINSQFGPRCPACETLLHRECWIDFDGCITFGCSENPDMKTYGK